MESNETRVCRFMNPWIGSMETPPPWRIWTNLIQTFLNHQHPSSLNIASKPTGRNDRTTKTQTMKHLNFEHFFEVMKIETKPLLPLLIGVVVPCQIEQGHPCFPVTTESKDIEVKMPHLRSCPFSISQQHTHIYKYIYTHIYFDLYNT